ncbi:pyridoxal phosphate-dependent decarboxylase family protein [Flagellimonas algicola]|uniref:Diaminobutyrate decarboxylase n=1 Tax=Flagellimonas algicola TaxID=2583815 RepID=A0ABY2WLZ0_9FLAO|nr:pyridoxal-dependent decarboxylase [Allomuricauda algicola]TMU55546.1 diaminobutyrate decarboxylase [Allomuricauda algicola]
MNFTTNFDIVRQALEDFTTEIYSPNNKVIDQIPLDQLIQKLDLSSWIKEGGLEGQVLKDFLSAFLSYQTRLHHSGYLGHQCAAPHYAAALGGFINNVTNNVPSIYEMGPSSVALEVFLVNWMLEKVGWKPTPLTVHSRMSEENYGGGVLVNGGSIANLTALIMARTQVAPEVWQEGNPDGLSILLPSESHYSLTKAAGILGIGKKAIHFVEVDKRGAVIPDSLPGIFKKVQEKGHFPIALVANACNTPVGIYDPLDEIADFCQEQKLWLHVDGAHGASALLSETHGHKLKGVERADSLVWDAHKLLQVPSLCAALLVKNHKHLDQAMPVGDNASYLFHDKEQPGVDTLHRTIETTKPGLGERLFFVLGAIGEGGMAGFIDRQYQLTLEVYHYLQNLPDFECPAQPESNILCFQYTGATMDSLFLRKKLLETGEFYLTTTLFKGARYLRLVFMSPNTEFGHIVNLVTSIREIATKV